MISGRITARREARLRLVVSGASGRSEDVEFVLDAGFNGSLSLPRPIIIALTLPLAGNRRVILGDGSDVYLDVCLASIDWHGDPHEVVVLQTDGDPVVGMQLLEGCRVILDVVPDGDVIIDRLP